MAEGTDTVMILDSSEEEDEQEAEEEEPIDFAAEAAKTAARSLARSASQTYTKTLLPRCIEASSDPELQAQQLKALEAHADRHPEMARAKPAQPPPAPPASSPHSEEVSHNPSPKSHISPKSAHTSPKSAISISPASPSSNAPDSPSERPKKAAQRGTSMKTTEKREKSTTSPKSSKVQGADKGISPAKTPKVKKVAPKKEAQKPVPVASQDAAGETSDEALVRTETTLMIRSSPKATFNSSSLTRLPSGTWRGPVESSGNDREMFLRSLSKHESMPLITFRPRRGKDLWVTNVSNPAPDTYPCLDERLRCTSKYEAPRQVSFGFSRKGSRWPANAEQKPGPGAHSLVNFERFKFADPVRHSFGGAPRCRPNPIRDSGPGPGAYGIQKSADEEGPAVTMTGKFRKRGVLNYDDPGPGAYDPSDVLCAPTQPSVGFATALRQDFYPKEDKGIPAPGTYVTKPMPVGSENLAFSMSGKWRKNDLTAHLYAGPGPGFYNHGSSFGYRSTWQPKPPKPPPIIAPPPMKPQSESVGEAMEVVKAA